MTPEQRQAAQRLFDEVMKLGTPDPGSWVARNSEDPVVLAEVRRMLVTHGSIATHAESGAAAHPVRLSDPLLGQVMGEFKIERLIGTGGMGRVYLAHPTSNPSQSIALKVLGRGLSGSIALTRFQREAEVMERLHHPSIARFLGGGMYDDGDGAVPWFAMEYVPESTQLDHWCQKRRLGLREKVGLLAEVCDAIGYAHRSGVMHRDLKPANILMTDAGIPKVIDFGVARCLGDDAGIATVRTQTGTLVGTMVYMSPEQYRGDPRKVDQRADVYALGVIAFELIAGSYPHDVRACSVADAAHTVCELDAPDIRTCAGDVDETLARIIRHALARTRDSRFDDAGTLGRALREWLRGEGELLKSDTLGGLEERRSPVELRPAREIEHTRVSRAGGASAHELEHQPVARSSGWLFPTISVMLLAVIVVMATGLVTPTRMVEWWKVATGASGQGGGAATDQPPDAVLVEDISINSDPVGATVTIDGASVGMTPCRAAIAWQHGKQSASVAISKSGYRPVTRVVAAAPRGGRSRPLEVFERLDPASNPSAP